MTLTIVDLETGRSLRSRDIATGATRWLVWSGARILLLDPYEYTVVDAESLATICTHVEYNDGPFDLTFGLGLEYEPAFTFNRLKAEFVAGVAGVASIRRQHLLLEPAQCTLVARKPTASETLVDESLDDESLVNRCYSWATTADRRYLLALCHDGEGETWDLHTMTKVASWPVDGGEHLWRDPSSGRPLVAMNAKRLEIATATLSSGNRYIAVRNSSEDCCWFEIFARP